MSFNKGDKVWMINTGSAGFSVPSMRGTVVRTSPSMMVTLESGDIVIQRAEDDPDFLVKFRKDWTPDPQPTSRHFFSPKNLFLNIFNK